MLVGAGRADTTATVVSLGEEQLFIVSVHDRGNLHYVACAVGAYGDGRFEPETWYRLTYGPAPYAASFYRDNQGRPGLIAWLRGIADPGGAGPEP